MTGFSFTTEVCWMNRNSISDGATKVRDSQNWKINSHEWATHTAHNQASAANSLLLHVSVCLTSERWKIYPTLRDYERYSMYATAHSVESLWPSGNCLWGWTLTVWHALYCVHVWRHFRQWVQLQPSSGHRLCVLNCVQNYSLFDGTVKWNTDVYWRVIRRR